MKLVIILFFLFSGSMWERPQSFESRYISIYKNGSQEEMRTFLHSWEVGEPNNPEMYIAHFNYYFQNSQEELFRVIEQSDEDQHLESVYSNSNELVGYMQREYIYNDSLFDLAMKYINEGIYKNPKRLDMYLGKIYSQAQTGDVAHQKDEMLKIISLHKKHPDQWLWKNGDVVENPDLYFKEAIQEYINNLFYEEGIKIHELEEVSQAMAKLYPNEADSYCNLGTCSYLSEDYERALKYFKKAHKQSPEDVTVLNNIVCTFYKLNDPKAAVPYLEMIIKYGDPQAAEFAKNKMAHMEDLKQ